MQKKIYFNELFFAIYLFMFILLRMLTTTFQNISTLILFLAMLCLLFVSIIYNKGNLNKKFLVFLILSIFFWVIQILMFFNDMTVQYLYNFIIYGLISVYFFSNVYNIKEFLRYYSHISTVAFFIVSLDPILGLKFSATYMIFGFALLPAVCGLFIGWLLFQKKHNFLLILIGIMELLFFGNRSALLTSIIFIVILFIYWNRVRYVSLHGKILRIVSLIILIPISILLFSYSHDMLLYINNIFITRFNFHSYAVVTLINFTQDWNFEISYATRAPIRDAAIDYFERNNIWLGSGIGSFHNYYGIFSHNFILDILTSIGIIGLFIFSILFLFSLFRLRRADKYEITFFILFFCLSVIPLSFSSTFIETSEFWILLFFGYFYHQRVNAKLDSTIIAR